MDQDFRQRCLDAHGFIIWPEFWAYFAEKRSSTIKRAEARATDAERHTGRRNLGGTGLRFEADSHHECGRQPKGKAV